MIFIETIRNNLLSYCKKDSLAMVKIYDKLINLYFFLNCRHEKPRTIRKSIILERFGKEKTLTLQIGLLKIKISQSLWMR